MARALRFACLAALLTACVDAPDDRLTAVSRQDPACAVELLGALEAIRDELGLGFEVLDSDAEILGEQGTLEKRYTRDAVRFTAEFGFDADGDACNLQLWSMTEQRPGSTRTQSGDFGHVALDVCECR